MTIINSLSNDDHLHEECGIYGIFGTSDAAAHTALGLHALQHRGQEAAGIVATDGQYFNIHRGIGHVGENFGEKNQAVLAQLVGHSAIGHTRYSTTGETAVHNVQPLFADLEFGGFALCHNGNLTNALQMRENLVRHGSIFHSTMDTEVIIHLIARSRNTSVIDRLIDAMRQIDGGYSLICMSKDLLVGMRDPFGVRPLVLGNADGAYILCSETCGLDIIGADFVRDIHRGELVIIDSKGIQSFFPFPPRPSRFCVFEYIYFARPDSFVEGNSVYAARKNIGKYLAYESGVDADVVVPVPDSGVPAAIGYSEASNLPFDLGIIRNHYVGRTFIQPNDKVRHLGVKLKHNANRKQLEGKRVILVDDSIVRGTTSSKIVEMVRRAGATELHLRIASPPTTHSCFYGINTPQREELLAAQFDIQDMANKIGVDSLAFISIDGLYSAMGKTSRKNDNPQFCDACFTGEYPISRVDYDSGRIIHKS
ncbi:amidophosphoribosyltransferase [Candidatus Endolissoclinum faulkneri L2]|uniref:Amidophosphoribosyltransferase n=1 Tax=Candidatus Endolissoclinum faulkneri L2 TaxID=1193729 RepID=K7YNW6_9PROT|nr:amidophosphoribosyltransferase [Candidatus Endolissoclinum faulkneri]AFX99237.1 amidophosphoribosyltransferase [Candidatus Endolissoclinum faulkneri L2]